jgi:hypothetical protein
VLTLLTVSSSWVAGRLGADLDLRRRFVEQAYAYMPVAMVSLVVGLGGELFDAIQRAGMPLWAVAAVKVTLFSLGMAWSLTLGYRLIGAQGLAGARRPLALLPLLVGVTFVGLAWWPAIFGA